MPAPASEMRFGVHWLFPSPVGRAQSLRFEGGRENGDDRQTPFLERSLTRVACCLFRLRQTGGICIVPHAAIISGPQGRRLPTGASWKADRGLIQNAAATTSFRCCSSPMVLVRFLCLAFLECVPSTFFSSREGFLILCPSPSAMAKSAFARDSEGEVCICSRRVVRVL